MATVASRWKRFASYVGHLWETAKEAPFAGGWWLYFVITGIGIAGVTWLIPAINESRTSPETTGVYVLGILLTVFADALFIWKKSKDDMVAETTVAVSVLLIILTGFFSTKGWVAVDNKQTIRDWRPFSEIFLSIIFFIAVLMWAMLNVVEPKLHNPVTQNSATLKDL